MFSHGSRGERVKLPIPAEIKAVRTLADQLLDGFIQPCVDCLRIENLPMPAKCNDKMRFLAFFRYTVYPFWIL